MNNKTALQLAEKQLSFQKNKTASLEAEVLLSFVLKKPKEFIYTYPKKNLTANQTKKLNNLIEKRKLGWPVAYLLKNKEFYDLNFYVDKRVFIPRPETELLVEQIIKQIINRQSPIANFNNLTIADIGTGSGCIAITLAKQLTKTKILASDISTSALKIAKKNARKHQVKIQFFQGNLLKPFANKRINIIVANLPYGWRRWKNNTAVETLGLKFEPQKSLFTKKQGLELYNQLFVQIRKRKQKPKLILIEFDPRQKKNLQAMIKKYLPKTHLTIKKDLAGLNRIFIIQF